VRAAGLTQVPEGSIYPTLSRLERDGHLSARMIRTQSGPARKYLSLSPSGERFMEERSRAWHSLAAVIGPLLVDETRDVEEATS